MLNKWLLLCHRLASIALIQELKSIYNREKLQLSDGTNFSTFLMAAFLSTYDFCIPTRRKPSYFDPIEPNLSMSGRQIKDNTDTHRNSTEGL